jgi:hypothetical protein
MKSVFFKISKARAGDISFTLKAIADEVQHLANRTDTADHIIVCFGKMERVKEDEIEAPEENVVFDWK